MLKIYKNTYVLSNIHKVKKLLAIFFLVFCFPLVSNAEIYRYMDENVHDGKEVIFSNGDVFRVESKTPGLFGQNLKKIENKSGKTRLLNIDSDIVFIRASFPSEKDAAVSIVSTSPAGNGISTINYYLIYLNDENKTNVIDIGGNDSVGMSIFAEIKKGHLSSLKVVGISDGDTDKFGDVIRYSLNLSDEKKFVKDGFQPKFLKLYGEYPETFFSDPQLREKLVKVIGYEKFRTLRSYVQVQSPAKLVDLRYFVLSGMMAHSGGQINGSLIIDTFSDNYWAIWFDGDAEINIGQTAKWNSKIIQIMIDSYSEKDYYKLSYENNKFIAKKR